MKYTRVDTAGTPELDELDELFRVASTLEKPTQVLKHFGAWYGRKRPTDFFMSIARRDLPDFQYKVTRPIGLVTLCQSRMARSLWVLSRQVMNKVAELTSSRALGIGSSRRECRGAAGTHSCGCEPVVRERHQC